MLPSEHWRYHVVSVGGSGGYAGAPSSGADLSTVLGLELREALAGSHATITTEAAAPCSSCQVGGVNCRRPCNRFCRAVVLECKVACANLCMASQRWHSRWILPFCTPGDLACDHLFSVICFPACRAHQFCTCTCGACYQTYQQRHPTGAGLLLTTQLSLLQCCLPWAVC
jgi:hypothetical protein